MGRIKLITTSETFVIATEENETVMEALRKHNVPVLGVMILDTSNGFVPLTTILDGHEEVRAYSMRNADFSLLKPHYSVNTVQDAITELIQSDSNGNNYIQQFNRSQAMEFVNDSVFSVLRKYLQEVNESVEFQVALSPGGDGRILAESIYKFSQSHPKTKFHCVIVAVGFEDESEHIENAILLAKRFNLPYSVFGVKDAAKLLGYKKSLKKLSDEYKSRFPYDEPEVMLTYWVQEINFKVAKSNNRRAIIFGYNQEDVLAEKFYQLLSGKILPNMPIRTLPDFDVISPLYRIPKKMLDSMDVENSMRNYTIRTPSKSYLRSSLYLLAYQLLESFPALATSFIEQNKFHQESELKDWVEQAMFE
jgi:hypothetical protein